MPGNCGTSAAIGCLFCCQGCSAEKLRNDHAFVPPVPSYMIDSSVVEDGQVVGTKAGRLELVSDHIKGFAFYQKAVRHAEVHLLSTSLGERIPVVWMRNGPSGKQAVSPRKGRPLVILHCHGNATDIGVMLGPYFELTKKLGCEVVGVEYTGYGVSSGWPSARNALADVEAAYNFIVGAGVPPERIVVYGQSVGSGPALALAAQKPLGGLVLHSPMLSGIQVIDPQPDKCCKPSCVWCCFDFFPNDRLITQVSCPAFVMHGQVDDIIPVAHGLDLAEATPKAYQWPGYFPTDAGHHDIVEMDASAYFRELGGFLNNIGKQAVGVSGGTNAARGAIIGKPPQMEMDAGEKAQAKAHFLS